MWAGFIWRWASLKARRRISWTDQRMSSLVFEISFFSACCWLDVGRQPSCREIGHITSAVDKGLPFIGDISREHTDLAVRDLARGTGILSRNPARSLALFEKACLIDHENGLVVTKVLDGILPHDSAQGIGIPSPAPQQSLLPPRSRIARRLARIQPVLRGSLPSSTSRKRAADAATRSCVNKGRTRSLIPRSEEAHKLQRLLDRSAATHHRPNHGHPWIQNSL
jgi:hypothetical protein